MQCNPFLEKPHRIILSQVDMSEQISLKPGELCVFYLAARSYGKVKQKCIAKWHEISEQSQIGKKGDGAHAHLALRQISDTSLHVCKRESLLARRGPMSDAFNYASSGKKLDQAIEDARLISLGMNMGEAPTSLFLPPLSLPSHWKSSTCPNDISIDLCLSMKWTILSMLP